MTSAWALGWVRSIGTALVCACLHIQFAATSQVECWGNNLSGELGDGTTNTRSRALIISSLLGVTSVTAGDQHTCAQFANGDSMCWGSNGSGRLGDGTLQPRTTPTLVSAACN